MSEAKVRDRISELAASLFSRGLTFGAAGNISVRINDGWLMTPTVFLVCASMWAQTPAAG